jgi:hypothetical protein
LGRLVCKNCNGYYVLKPNERARDFECCSLCNGKLEYVRESKEKTNFNTYKNSEYNMHVKDGVSSDKTYNKKTSSESNHPDWDISTDVDGLIRRQKRLAEEERYSNSYKKGVVYRHGKVKTNVKSFKKGKGRSYIDEKIFKYKLFMVLGVIVFMIGIIGVIFSFLLSFFVLVGAFILFYGYDNSKRWIKGSKGEKLVAKHLKVLPKDYFVFNNVFLPVNRGDIDHIVVGTNGIFAIETKNLSGCFIVDDDEWFYERHYEVVRSRSQPGKQIKANVMILLDYLNSNGVNTENLWINSIVAFTNPNLIIEERPKHYDILSPSKIPEFIISRKKTLNKETLKKAVNLIEPYTRDSSIDKMIRN